MSAKEVTIAEQQRLTLCASRNLAVNTAEFYRRIQSGLSSSDRLEPSRQIDRFLEGVRAASPAVDSLTNALAPGMSLQPDTRIVVTIPAVGFADQEQGDLVRTIQFLLQDPFIRAGKAAVLVLVNRPEGESPDSTAQTARQSTRVLKNACVFDLEIPKVLGNISGPFADEMATGPNDVPIGLIRDLLTLTAMKMYSPSLCQTPPAILQMDADFTGFKSGNLSAIANYFDAYPQLDFLQCTSDWDSPEIPTKNTPPLLVGSELMRELPQILKRQLRNTQLPDVVLQQIIFGEAIQRGIQVPQAERMESIAQKGGYGLNRLKEDELDTNLRMTAICRGLRSIAGTDTVVFNWSNRRALASWNNYRKPPISQWQTSFSARDPVRGQDRLPTAPTQDDPGLIALAVSATLERLPLPISLPGVYENFAPAILGILNRYFTSKGYGVKNLGTGNYTLTIKT